jgi:hypothetical protein
MMAWITYMALVACETGCINTNQALMGETLEMPGASRILLQSKRLKNAYLTGTLALNIRSNNCNSTQACALSFRLNN